MTVYQLKNTTIFTGKNLKSFWSIGKKSKEFFNLFFFFFTDASLSRTGKCRSRVAAVLNTYKVKEVCEEEASRKLNFTSYVKIVIDGWKKKRIRKWYFGMLYFQQQSINITINHGAQIWCICYAKNVLRAIRFGKSWTIALMCQYNAKEYNVNQISSTCLL